ncbi:hypothetical protein JXR93_07655 [bacterium]|nr:hypothetical protein [bacterium]
MIIAFSKIETQDGSIKDFEPSSFEKIDEMEFSLLQKTFLYLLYYYPILSNSIPEDDLSTFDLYDPAFVRAVFIIEHNSKYYKLNCSISPVEYHLSSFNPETKESTLISSQSREIYSFLKTELKIYEWEDFAQLYILGHFPKQKESEDISTDGLSLALGTTTSDEPQLRFGGTSSYSYDDDVESEKKDKSENISTDTYDKLPIEQRRVLLSKLKDDLLIAEKIKNIKTSLKTVQKQILYFETVQTEIKNRENMILKKRDSLLEFSSISWVTSETYKAAQEYTTEKGKFEDNRNSLVLKLERVEKNISMVAPDNIFSNKIFILTFLAGVITFLISWILRDSFRFVGILSALFFTVAFYYLWGYIDYLDTIRKLRRERKFLFKKREEVEKTFNKKFGQLEDLLKKFNITDINFLTSTYERKISIENEISDLENSLNKYKNSEFNSEKQSLYKSILSQKIELEKDLERVDKKDLKVEDIEYQISVVKNSIKKYEKQELEAFSLDDEDDLELSQTTDSSKTDELSLNPTQIDSVEHNNEYSLQFFIDYLKLFESIFNIKADEIYQKISKDFEDIKEYALHFPHELQIDFENNQFKLFTDESIEFNLSLQNKFLLFAQYALLKLSFKKTTHPLFVKIPFIQKKIGIYIFPYIDELKDTQIFYIA